VLGRTRAAGPVRELAWSAMTLSLVIGAAAALLRGLDALPGYLHADPPGIRRLSSIEEAERRLQGRIVVPPYFPDTLRWPPAVILVHDGPPSAVALTFVDRAGEPRLLVFQSSDTDGSPPRELVWPVVVLQRTTVRLSGQETALLRVLGKDGDIWHEVTWAADHHRILLRFRGPIDQLLAMAESVRSLR
jgi:hypothetical protein